MSRLFRDVRDYCRIFGFRGIYFVLEAKLLTTSKEVEAKVPSIRDPLTLRLKTSDIGTYLQVFINQDYDFTIAETPRMILDAGANIGLTSIYFTHKFPEATILAMEPEESNFAVLEKNTAPYRRIIPSQAALWCENTWIDLIDPGLGKWGFQTYNVNDNNAISVRHKVQGMTVDKIMQDQGIEFIDILKMDIEGAEKEVFQDPSKWIDKVGVLIVELHEHLKTGCNRSFYNATNNFDIERKKGENIYLAKEEKGLTIRST
ncbi:MAG: FkbM family methyltransferase [Deltaproteobacteria bacterium]|nr:MAG: FkbM family methyltransferase [Deltaproteobacteria bacterium]